MNLFKTAVAITIVLLVSVLSAENENGMEASNVLFVYDKVDKGSQFYIDAFRRGLKETGCTFTEAAVESAGVGDLSPYHSLVIYSRVMAFDSKSPVRSWIKLQKSLKDKKIFLYVTASRWFFEKHQTALLKLINDRGGEVVDAVSMATNKMTEDQKRTAIGKHLSKLK